jgi:hypothetical protein
MKSALVVISHYNAWPTDRLVALLDQTREIPSGYPFRYLIAVNRAIDRDLELPERYAGIEIVYRENTGYNLGAWNYAWRLSAPADYYLFLQEEVRIVRPNWLGAFIREISKPSIGMVGESMAWSGLDWRRVEYFHIGSEFQGHPSEVPIDHIGGVKRFLKAKGIPLSERAEHMQAFILAMRRDVLERIDGFLVGLTKGDAIACEVAVTHQVVALGLKVEQIGWLPFKYIFQPQWALLDEGPYTLIMQWVDRFTPISLMPLVRNSVFRLRKFLMTQRYEREAPEEESLEHSASTQGTAAK